METTSLFNHETNTWEQVPVDQVDNALASGNYSSGGAVLSEAAGGVVTRNQSDLDTARTQGERPAIVQAAQAAAQSRADERSASLSDPVLSFSEALVDALSLGLIHIPGEKADIRRSTDKNSVLLGTLVGTGVGLVGPGPLSAVSKGGEKLGRAAAQGLLGEERLASTAGKMIKRAAEEAGTNAAIMGATAFGHSLTDVIIEDKPFAGEAIAAEAGLGALLGGGFGLLSGGFSAARAASKGSIRAQGGLVAGELGTAVDELAGVRQAMDKAVENHAQRVGVIDALVKDGQVPESFVKPRQDLLRKARAAADNLAGLDPAKAMAGDAKSFGKYQEALERYHEATGALDDAMRMSDFEHAQIAARNPLGANEVIPGPAHPPVVTKAQGVPMDFHAMDAAMSPERKAMYKQLYGEEWRSVEKRWDDFFVENPEFDELAQVSKPVESETSELGTRAGKGGRAPAPAAEVAEVAEVRPGTTPGRAAGEALEAGSERSAVLSEVDRPGPFTREGSPAGQAPYAAPKMPGARFSPADLAGEAGVAKPLRQRWGEHPELLGNAVHPVDQFLMTDGRIRPVKSIEQNAQDFLSFRERVLNDTFAPKAPEAALEAGTRPGSYKPGTQVLDGMATKPGGVLREPEALNAVDKERLLPGAKTKERIAPEADTGEFVSETAKTAERESAPRGPIEYSPEGKEALRKWADQWREMGGAQRVTPGDEMAVRFQEALGKLREASGGRIDSAAALEIGEKLGLKPARTPLGDALQQMYAIRQAAGMVADEARGVTTALGASKKNYVKDWILRRLGGKAGAAVVGGIVGNQVGGPVGFAVGAALASRYASFGAKAAATAGRLYERVIATGDTLLKGGRATMISRAMGGNRPYQYSDAGPIQDPVKRIQDLQRVAANPELARSIVREAMGDVVGSSPDVAQHIEETAVRQLQALAVKAPAIYFNALGVPLTPSMGKMRKFFEYENATHNLDGLLNAVAGGGASDAQLDALKMQFPMVHSKLAAGLLADPAKLRKLPASAVRSIERVLGLPLTRATTDPGYVQRMQESWISPKQQSMQGQAGPQKAQAFKISSPVPTPAQANASGRAPGN